MSAKILLRGRGAGKNPPNRFESLIRIKEPMDSNDPTQHPPSELIIDSSRTIISSDDSPDVPFESSLNPYRGCEHGCPYCYARPTHEYLGFSSGLDFETKILVKKDAPKLLEKALSSPQWVPKTLGMRGVTDPYQPIEKGFRISRKCLEESGPFAEQMAALFRMACKKSGILGASPKLTMDHFQNPFNAQMSLF